MNKQTVLQAIIDKLKVDLGVAQRAAYEIAEQLRILFFITPLIKMTDKIKTNRKTNLPVSFFWVAEF